MKGEGSIKKKRINNFLNELLRPIFYLIVGVICIIFDQKFLDISGYVLGAALILAGIIFVIIYLTREAIDNLNRNEMLLGMGSIALGIILLLRVDLFTGELFPVILAGMVILSGAAKLQLMVNMIKLKLAGWLPTLFVALLNIAFGVVLVIAPEFMSSVLIIVIGAGLVFSAVSDVVFIIYYDKQLKDKIRPEAAYRELPQEK
ncbi:MAG: DUF308 domain-containing protein [Lachnospiraceae bacterium]|nr:DUF308 domain-containing protein [Lachnospiraceae bacterium]